MASIWHLDHPNRSPRSRPVEVADIESEVIGKLDDGPFSISSQHRCATPPIAETGRPGLRVVDQQQRRSSAMLAFPATGRADVGLTANWASMSGSRELVTQALRAASLGQSGRQELGSTDKQPAGVVSSRNNNGGRLLSQVGASSIKRACPTATLRTMKQPRNSPTDRASSSGRTGGRSFPVHRAS